MKFKRGAMILVIISIIFGSVYSIGYTKSKPVKKVVVKPKAQPLKIVSIKNLSVNICTGQIYLPPKIVSAKYNNGTSKNVSVSWNKTLYYSLKPSSFIFIGTVKGYSSKIKLVCNVKGKSIVGNINQTVNKGDYYVLPQMVTVSLSNAMYKEMPVTWNKNIIDTSKPGTYTIEGKINGDNSKVTLVLTVGDYGAAVPVYIQDYYYTVCQGDRYVLPKMVTAQMNDKTTRQVAITWNTSTVNTYNIGTQYFEGTVTGYGSKVKLTLNVLSPAQFQQPFQVISIE